MIKLQHVTYLHTVLPRRCDHPFKSARKRRRTLKLPTLADRGLNGELDCCFDLRRVKRCCSYLIGGLVARRVGES